MAPVSIAEILRGYARVCLALIPVPHAVSIQDFTTQKTILSVLGPARSAIARSNVARLAPLAPLCGETWDWEVGGELGTPERESDDRRGGVWLCARL